jgi:hypothetical protein
VAPVQKGKRGLSADRRSSAQRIVQYPTSGNFMLLCSKKYLRLYEINAPRAQSLPEQLARTDTQPTFPQGFAAMSQHRLALLAAAMIVAVCACATKSVRTRSQTLDLARTLHGRNSSNTLGGL